MPFLLRRGFACGKHDVEARKGVVAQLVDQVAQHLPRLLALGTAKLVRAISLVENHSEPSEAGTVTSSRSARKVSVPLLLLELSGYPGCVLHRAADAWIPSEDPEEPARPREVSERFFV